MVVFLLIYKNHALHSSYSEDIVKILYNYNFDNEIILAGNSVGHQLQQK